MTLEQLASEIGTNTSFISGVENDHTDIPAKSSSSLVLRNKVVGNFSSFR